jgi:hypothetical protein
MFKKSSPLKLLGHIKPNLTGSIYVRSSIKILHLVPFGKFLSLFIIIPICKQCQSLST